MYNYQQGANPLTYVSSKSGGGCDIIQKPCYGPMAHPTAGQSYSGHSQACAAQHGKRMRYHSNICFMSPFRLLGHHQCHAGPHQPDFAQYKRMLEQQST